MIIVHRGYHVRLLPATLVLGLGIATLAACSGSSTPSGNPNAISSSDAQASASGGDPASDLPKVPFDRQPCRSLSTEEQKDLKIAKPAPDKPTPGHEPDDLAFDNTCDFGYQTLVYTTKHDYVYQRDNLRSPKRAAPADLPGAFYDVLGNLWFAEKGYYVTIPNNVADATREKMARVIAAKL